MGSQSLTAEEIAAFHRDGYVVRKALFDAEEVALMNREIQSDPQISANVYSLKDSAGASTELALWKTAGDDVFGSVARSARMVDSMEALLGEEIYHFHSKLTLKRPRVGGAWDWHQDYGYWYANGCLWPHMASVFVAVDAADRDNGCLEVLRGSHRLGRLDHGVTGTQTGADPVRLAAAMEQLDHVYVEMDAGDALFFHALTLHASGQNRSERSRNTLLCCYNVAGNSPILADSVQPAYSPIRKLPNEAVKAAGRRETPVERVYHVAG